MDNLVYKYNHQEKVKSKIYTGDKIKYFKEKEYKELISNAKNNFYKMVYLFLFELAPRISEARLVKIKDIDFENRKVKIVTKKQKRDNTFRVLYFSDTLAAQMLIHTSKDNYFEEEDLLFAKKPGGKAITQQAVDYQLKKDILKLGIKTNGSCHVFRHSRAIQLLDSNKVNIVKLKNFLGHSNIQNTLIYLQYSNNDLKDSIMNANEVIGL